MKKLILTTTFFALSITAQSQVGVGTTDPKAGLDITSDKGMLLPRMADHRTLVPVDGTLDTNEKGLQVYNTTTNKVMLWTGAAWVASATGTAKFVDGTTPADAVFTGGKVGIGTDNPEKPLHLASSGAPTFILERTSNATDRKKRFISVSDAGQMSFGSFPDDMSSFKTHLFIGATGDVGIGTLVPSSNGRLHLFSDSSNLLTIESSNAGENGVRLVNTEGEFRLRLSGDGNFVLADADNSSSTSPFIVEQGNSSNVFRMSGNKIGISDATPDYKLDIEDDSNSVLAASSYDPTNMLTGGHIVTGVKATSNRVGTASFIDLANFNAQVLLGSYYASSNNSSFVLGTETGGTITEKLRVTSNGRVGIGTTTPGSKLAVVGLPTGATEPAGLSAGDFWVTSGHATLPDGVVMIKQ